MTLLYYDEIMLEYVKEVGQYARFDLLTWNLLILEFLVMIGNKKNVLVVGYRCVSEIILLVKS